MPEWKNDTELFTLMRDVLYTPVVGDILDQLGCYHQFLPQPIQPIREYCKVAGRAMPALVDRRPRAAEEAVRQAHRVARSASSRARST